MAYYIMQTGQDFETLLQTKILQWFFYMLKTRLTTATIFCAIIIYILSFSPPALFYPLFVFATTLAIFLSGTEFAALRWNIPQNIILEEQKKPDLKVKHFAVGFCYAFLVVLNAISEIIFQKEPHKILILPITWTFLCFFISAGLIYRSAQDLNSASHKILNIISGFIYLALPAACLTHLSLISIEGPYRSAPVYFCLATILMGDTGAYFIGSVFGKHKLLPKISPKKSVEGAIGGLCFSTFTAFYLNELFQLPFPTWLSFVFGMCMGIAGQIGDLLESAFKRAGGFKDSGNLLPGHGGFLDRVDSLILGIPVAFLFFSLYS